MSIRARIATLAMIALAAAAITATRGAAQDKTLTIGVLGPLRMDYARALAVVDAVGSQLAERLA